jgi:hypothetical protein
MLVGDLGPGWDLGYPARASPLSLCIYALLPFPFSFALLFMQNNFWLFRRTCRTVVQDVQGILFGVSSQHQCTYYVFMYLCIGALDLWSPDDTCLCEIGGVFLQASSKAAANMDSSASAWGHIDIGTCAEASSSSQVLVCIFLLPCSWSSGQNISLLPYSPLCIYVATCTQLRCVNFRHAGGRARRFYCLMLK